MSVFAEGRKLYGKKHLEQGENQQLLQSKSLVQKYGKNIRRIIQFEN